MQISSLGSEHSSDMHHVSNCMHNHSSSSKVGSVGGASSASEATNLSAAAQQQIEGELSLSAWLNAPLGSAKRLFGSIWNGSDGDGTEIGAVSGKEAIGQDATLMQDGKMTVLGEKALAEMALGAENKDAQQHVEQSADVIAETLHTPRVAAAAAMAQQTDFQDNPYFAAVENEEEQQETVWQKLRVRFQSVTGFFSNRFSFSNRNSFQAKREQSKEDLRRHSKFHGDAVEIDCILMDESHLRDSYNKKGEYSRLAGEVQGHLSLRN